VSGETKADDETVGRSRSKKSGKKSDCAVTRGKRDFHQSTAIRLGRITGRGMSGGKKVYPRTKKQNTIILRYELRGGFCEYKDLLGGHLHKPMHVGCVESQGPPALRLSAGGQTDSGRL